MTGAHANRRPSAVIFASVLALCCLAWLPTAGRAERPPTAHVAQGELLGGVNINTVYGTGDQAVTDREIAQARSLHSKLVRVEVPWSQLEPFGPSQVDPRALAGIDRLVNDASGAAIKLILLVESSPCWASSAPAPILRKCVPGRIGRANAWPPNSPASYGAFVAYLTRRYGAQLAAVEVWNEPDQANEDYFAGPDKPARYAAVLRAAHAAIKSVDPGMTVLAGSIVGSNGIFLRALYAAGIKGLYDGLSVHFYNLTLGSLRSIHEVQLANGDTTPLWLDEFGWSSCWPRQRIQQEQACVTQQIQARNLRDTMRSLARTPYVAAAVPYKLQDSSHEAFGVLSTTGAPKPAYAALAGALSSPFGSISPVRLKLHRKGRRIVASGSGPVGDFMQLEAFRGAALRYRALFTLDRFNDYSITLPAALGTRGLRVRVFQYWSGSATAAQKGI